MRQLTSLDAQFLGVETSRTYGHVGGLAVYDPSTAPGGTLEIGDVCRMVSERLHMLPPFRWRLVWVPFGLDHPYWIEDPDFDIDPASVATNIVIFRVSDARALCTQLAASGVIMGALDVVGATLATA